VAVIEDDPVLLEILGQGLAREGYDHSAPPDAERFLLALDGGLTPDVAVVDVRLPGRDGLAVLERLRDEVPTCRVVMMTAFRSYDSLLDALRGGAVDFLLKPVTAREVLEAVRRSLQRHRSDDRVAETAVPYPPVAPMGGLAGSMGPSRAVRSLQSLVEKAAASEVAVLITGETGTGKELVARAVHEAGPRAGRPMVAVNCAAIPESLLEAELFGHRRGSFTGANEDRPGLIEAADGSTLFLDEVGELSAGAQVKLLRVLQERQVRRVGGRDPRAVDIRLIAASNLDLEAEVAAGRFRQDLYYRLSVLRLRLPPLRERREDIPFLVDRFLGFYGAGRGERVEVSTRALKALERYTWPGNVRQLENEVARAVTLADGTRIDLADLSEEVRSARAVRTHGGLRASLEHQERRLIMATLEETGWNKTETARRLGMSRQNLYQRLDHHDIPRHPPPRGGRPVKED